MAKTPLSALAPVENFSSEEQARLEPYVTNLDRPVFVLKNLSEVVKGALFARYSRSAKSLRRLLLDEFLGEGSDSVAPVAGAGEARSEELYDRIFVEYGDDSVAQLGGVHLACEGASNILTKVLEWGRLAAYLEQSTRYVPYHRPVEGRFKYHIPAELLHHPLRGAYEAACDLAFETYARWFPVLVKHLEERHPPEGGVPDRPYRMSIRAKALDALRGLLPAATRSNVGIYATGQAYENMLIRMRARPESEVQAYADLILGELRKIVPAFMTRVDRGDRGGAWSDYLETCARQTAAIGAELVGSGVSPDFEDEVRLTDYDPEGEVKVVAAALYAVSRVSDRELLARARAMSPEERARILTAYVGPRINRRHKPGRAFERTSYRFDVLGDYGAFRDLQRHRLLTIEWQPLSTSHGYALPLDLRDARAEEDFARVMQRSREAYEALVAEGLATVAPYVVSMAHRIRYVIQMNAREAMHLIELRSSPQGHASYRRVAQQMHRQIAEGAGHRGIAEAMRFVSFHAVDLERLEAERAADRRRGC